MKVEFSREKIRVAVCIPSSGQCKTFFAHSLAGLMMCAQVLRGRVDAASFDITVLVQESSVIHANRELLVLEAIKWDCTHVLFLDDDMAFNPAILEMMLSRRQPYVACNYPKRGFPITFTAIRADGTGTIVTTKESTGLEEANYTGFGAALIERRVFDKTKKPWFLPLYLKKEQVYTTEDNPFCQRIRKAGFKSLVDHEASKLIGHIGMCSFDWRMWKPEPSEKPEDRPAFSVVPNAVKAA